MALRLTERDKQILSLLSDSELIATTEQIEKLFFNSKRVCQKRLQRLSEQVPVLKKHRPHILKENIFYTRNLRYTKNGKHALNLNERLLITDVLVGLHSLGCQFIHVKAYQHLVFFETQLFVVLEFQGHRHAIFCSVHPTSTFDPCCYIDLYSNDLFKEEVEKLLEPFNIDTINLVACHPKTNQIPKTNEIWSQIHYTHISPDNILEDIQQLKKEFNNRAIIDWSNFK